MIHPSYSELIEAINTNTEDDDNTMQLKQSTQTQRTTITQC